MIIDKELILHRSARHDRAKRILMVLSLNGRKDSERQAAKNEKGLKNFLTHETP